MKHIKHGKKIIRLTETEYRVLHERFNFSNFKESSWLKGMHANPTPCPLCLTRGPNCSKCTLHKYRSYGQVGCMNVARDVINSGQDRHLVFTVSEMKFHGENNKDKVAKELEQLTNFLNTAT